MSTKEKNESERSENSGPNEMLGRSIQLDRRAALLPTFEELRRKAHQSLTQEMRLPKEGHSEAKTDPEFELPTLHAVGVVSDETPAKNDNAAYVFSPQVSGLNRVAPGVEPPIYSPKVQLVMPTPTGMRPAVALKPPTLPSMPALSPHLSQPSHPMTRSERIPSVDVSMNVPAPTVSKPGLHKSPPTLPAPKASLPAVNAPVRSRPAIVKVKAQVEEVLAIPATNLRRTGAFLIDGLFVMGVVAVYFYVAAMVAKDAYQSMVIALSLIGLALLCVVGAVYGAMTTFAFRGQSLGRLVMGLELVDENGATPNVKTALTRSAISMLSFAFFGLGYFVSFFTERAQTMHDLLTNTFLVKVVGRQMSEKA